MAEEDVAVEPEVKEGARAERERQDQERADDNARRQARQGIVPVEDPEAEEQEESKSKAKAKKSE